MKLSKYGGVKGVIGYAIRIGKAPVTFTDSDLDAYCQELLKNGRQYNYIQFVKSNFRKFLSENQLAEKVPGIGLSLHPSQYGIPLVSFPPLLRQQVMAVLAWKQAPYVYGRPARARHRPVTGKRLEAFTCRLYGYAINILKLTDVTTLAELVREVILAKFTEWAVNERKLNGAALVSDLRLLYAAMRSFPDYKQLDFKWFPPLIAGVPVEPESLMRERKLKKWLSYDALEGVAARIDEECERAKKVAGKELAWLKHDALVFRWLVTFVWRQRNIRECRISGSQHNLFKAEIAPFSNINIPPWAKKKLMANPLEKLWQIHFREWETKMGHEFRALVPLRLVVQLEEYLDLYRPQLARKVDPPETLFLNRAGGALTPQEFRDLISAITAKYAGVRITPHIVRDILASAWLDAHPENYLTLQKMLWHRDIKTTLRIYGAGIDESHALCRVEQWLDEREAGRQQKKKAA